MTKPIARITLKFTLLLSVLCVVLSGIEVARDTETLQAFYFMAVYRWLEFLSGVSCIIVISILFGLIVLKTRSVLGWLVPLTLVSLDFTTVSFLLYSYFVYPLLNSCYIDCIPLADWSLRAVFFIIDHVVFDFIIFCISVASMLGVVVLKKYPVLRWLLASELTIFIGLIIFFASYASMHGFFVDQEYQGIGGF